MAKVQRISRQSGKMVEGSQFLHYSKQMGSCLSIIPQSQICFSGVRQNSPRSGWKPGTQNREVSGTNSY